MSANNIYIENLPTEILVKIFKYLNLSDIRNLMLSCKIFKNFISHDSSLWRNLYKEKLILQNHRKNPNNTLTWYNKCRISQNWRKGIFKSKVIIHHKINYMPWLQMFPEQLLVSVGSKLECYSTSLVQSKKLLWSINVPTVKRYDVRTNDISRFVVKDDFIVCGNRDGSIAVFDLVDIKEKPKLLQHIKNCHDDGQVEVTAVEAIDNLVLTGSNSYQDICLWFLKRDKRTSLSFCRQKSVKLPSCVGCRSLAVNQLGNKLAIGPNGNCKPLLLDLNIEKICMNSNLSVDVKRVIRDICWHDENGLVYVTHSGILNYFDIRIGAVTYETLDPLQASLYCVKTDGDRAIVVGTSEYSRSVLFDLRSPAHIQMYFTQKKSSPVYSLDFDSTKLLTAVDRGVAILNFNVNPRISTSRDYSHTFDTVQNFDIII